MTRCLPRNAWLLHTGAAATLCRTSGRCYSPVHWLIQNVYCYAHYHHKHIQSNDAGRPHGIHTASVLLPDHNVSVDAFSCTAATLQAPQQVSGHLSVVDALYTVEALPLANNPKISVQSGLADEWWCCRHTSRFLVIWLALMPSTLWNLLPFADNPKLSADA